MNQARQRKKHGAIFTVDALIAAGAVFIVVLGILAVLAGAGSDRDESSGERLRLAASDSGQVLELDGSLTSLASGSASLAQGYLDALEAGLCADIVLYSTEGAELDALRKAGCGAIDDSVGQVGIANRILPSGGSTYVVEVRAWNS